MSWNRPSEEAARRRVKVDATSSSRHWWYIVGAIVVLGAAVAAWWFWPDESAPVAEDGDGTVRRHIREVTPAPARTNETAATTPSKPKERPAQRVGEIRDGFILLSSGELYPVKSVITVNCARVSLEDRSFERFSDRLIGSLLRIEPGEGLLGSSEDLFAGFDKEFEESLAYPIEIKHDDPDDVKEMKQAVIELRKELKERRAKGEDIEKIMIDSRNQLMELAAYRDELEQQVDKLMSDNDFSEKDANDLVNAANLMLEERGAKPLDLPVAAIYAIRHMSQGEEPKEQEVK